MAFSELDEFDVYRKHHSYYFSDDGRPDFVVMTVGGGANMLFDVAQQFDFHGAPGDDGRSTTEVALLHGERRIPIYITVPPGLGRARVLVEGFALPVWVVAPDREIENRLRSRYSQFADFVAYWLWQVATDVSGQTDTIGESERQFVFELDLVESESWFSDTPIEDGEPLRWRVASPDRIVLRFHPIVTDRLTGPTNAGEREIVRELIRALAEAAGTNLGDDAIALIVDRRAPLGQKKKLVMFRLRNDPRLDTSALPQFRTVQQADESELLDDAGAFLVDARGYPYGAVQGRQAQRDTVNEVVQFHFDQLEDLVATLSSKGLLEWLLAAHEAVVAHQAIREIQAPSELACFSTAPPMVERIADEISASAQAAISSRFLIEYVAARPPNGLRPMSLAVYDRMLALASEIFNRGSLSDLIHHELAQPDLSILGAKRLGVDPATIHQPGRDQFRSIHAGVELDRRMSEFRRLWEPPPERAGQPEELQALDEAVAIELGVSLTDIVAFQIEVVNAGLERPGEPKVAPYEELRAELSASLGWDEGRVEHALELSLLRPRHDFLGPSAPFRTVDVYPWRFDRALSYSRRPLVLRRTPSREEIIWGTRHVYAASRYFFELCTNGRFQAQTLELKRAMSARRTADARDFNDLVADLLQGRSETVVKRRVTKFGRTKIEKAPGQLITDIDVLCADRRRRQLLLIETKNLAVARTPAELAHELRELYRGEHGGSSAVERLLEATNWVLARRPHVLASLGLPTNDATRWRVRPLVVVDQELLTPYLFAASVPTLSYRAFTERIDNGRPL